MSVDWGSRGHAQELNMAGITVSLDEESGEGAGDTIQSGDCDA